MDATTVYTLATLAWLSAQGLPLVLWPSFVATLLITDTQVAPVAVYFARALGLAQLALGLLVLVLSGLLPLRQTDDAATAADASAATVPYASATVLLSTLYHSAAAFYSYGCYYSKMQPTMTAYAVGCAGSGALAALGLWCMLFGTGSHISRRTGADKRTSGFPFRNKEADKRKVR